MFKAYAPEELFDALVVDSEGYICGHVESVTVQKGKPVVKVYEKEMVSDSVTDFERLETVLLSTVKKIIGKPSVDDLHRQIMKEMDVDGVTNKTLEEYAATQGVRIPKKKVSEVRKKAGGSVAWRDVVCINKTELGTCILLKVPIEATKRGLKVKKRVPYRAYEELGPKMIIDAEGRIVGKVGGLKFGAEGPNLQLVRDVSITVERRVLDEDKLLDDILSESSMEEDDLYGQIAEDLGLQGADSVTSENLFEWAKKEGYSIPTKKAPKTKKHHYEHVIPWGKIRKIGDVVLLKNSIGEIASDWKSYEELKESYEKELKESGKKVSVVAPPAKPYTCPSCGTVNKASAKFCRICGEKL